MFISVVFITVYEHDPTAPLPSSSDVQNDFLVALWGTLNLSVLNSLIWPHVHFFYPKFSSTLDIRMKKNSGNKMHDTLAEVSGR